MFYGSKFIGKNTTRNIKQYNTITNTEFENDLKLGGCIGAHGDVIALCISGSKIWLAANLVYECVLPQLLILTLGKNYFFTYISLLF